LDRAIYLKYLKTVKVFNTIMFYQNINFNRIIIEIIFIILSTSLFCLHVPEAILHL